MKFRYYGTALLISLIAIIFQWSCKNNIVGTSTPTLIAIQGIVYGSSFSSDVKPLKSAKVYLIYGNVIDSVTTDSTGDFRFGIVIDDTSKGVNVTLRVTASGYNVYTSSTFNVKSTPNPIPVTMTLNSANFAIFTGAVVDSSSSYPLPNATVTVALPGSSVSATTLQDGSYNLSVNLYSLDSLSITLTVTKDGFKTYRSALTLRKGTTIVDSVSLAIDKGATIAHVSGVVTDNRTGLPIPSVTVLLTSSIGNDSTKTLGDGSYRFDPNLNGLPSAPITLTFRSLGYNDQSVNLALNSGGSATENVVMTSNYNYANITGRVRDSVSYYVLAGAKVIVALSGNSSSMKGSKFLASVKSRSHSISSIILDSTTTFQDGSFSLAINLFDLESITATMTVSEPGYKVKQFSQTFIKGQNSLGNVLINIDNGLTTARITGYVTDKSSNRPLSGVSVYLQTGIKSDSTKTSYSGLYSFDLNLQGLSSISGSLLYRMNSYNDTTISFSVGAGQTLTQNAVLSAKPIFVIDTTISGVAKTFKLIGVTKNEISIAGASTGSSKDETSTITWQVLDSLGNPVDNTHQYKVTFSLMETPNGLGGARIIPDTAVTDGSGKIYATITSGTTAGVIQVTAQLKLSNGKIVQATPVPITVDAGLPDQAHFELNSNPPHARNFAGYDWSEVTQGFTAQVGDKYSNPVAAGTALYFNATAGVVTGAAQTDANGHANATLYSGLPLPYISPSILSSYSGLNASYFGSGTGYAFVKAWTLGESNVAIADSDLICISAKALYPAIELLSPSDTVHSGGSLLYHVHITDRFGNPLESGTKVTASVIVPPPPPGGGGDVWSVQAAGLGTAASGGSVVLGDNLVRNLYTYPGSREIGSTDFEVTLSATLTQGGPAAVTTFTLVIDVQGRNTGNDVYEATVSGVAIAP